MTTVITATKCLRPSCENRSADPETGDWAYIAFEKLVVGFAPESGFYCKRCADEIIDVLGEGEPLHPEHRNALSAALDALRPNLQPEPDNQDATNSHCH